MKRTFKVVKFIEVEHDDSWDDDSLRLMIEDFPDMKGWGEEGLEYIGILATDVTEIGGKK